MMKYLIATVTVTLSGCVSIRDDGDHIFSRAYAVQRTRPVVAIDAAAARYVETTGFWEMSEHRRYSQGDLDSDDLVDATMVTTYEQGQTFKRVMFVSLGSHPTHISTIELGGKGEQMASTAKIQDGLIQVEGMRYALTDGMCCPSLPFTDSYAVRDDVVKKIEPQPSSAP